MGRSAGKPQPISSLGTSNTMPQPALYPHGRSACRTTAPFGSLGGLQMGFLLVSDGNVVFVAGLMAGQKRHAGAWASFFLPSAE